MSTVEVERLPKCDVCGERPAAHFALQVDGELLRAQLDLCQQHGDEYLLEVGRVAGTMLRGVGGSTPLVTLPVRFLLMPYREYSATEWSTGFEMTREIAESMIAAIRGAVGQIPIFDREMDHMHPNLARVLGWANLEAADDGVWVVLCKWGDEARARESLEGETHLVPALELGAGPSKARFLYLSPTNQPQFDDVGKLPAA